MKTKLKRLIFKSFAIKALAINIAMLSIITGRFLKNE